MHLIALLYNYAVWATFHGISHVVYGVAVYSAQWWRYFRDGCTILFFLVKLILFVGRYLGYLYGSASRWADRMLDNTQNCLRWGHEVLVIFAIDLLTSVWKIVGGVLHGCIRFLNICSKETGEFCTLSWAPQVAGMWLLLRSAEFRVAADACFKFAFSIGAWILFYNLAFSLYGLCVLMIVALMLVTFVAYGAYSFVCAAIAWGRDWYEYQYPARVPLAQKWDLKALFDSSPNSLQL